MKRENMKKLFTILSLLICTISSEAQTVTGKLVDQGGKGLAGMQLKLYSNPKVYIAESGTDGSFTFSNITDVKEDELPSGYNVSENYPNPFNPRTRIQITMPNSGNVKIEAYNALGQKVIEDINKQFSAGSNSVELELNGLTNGIYLARISIDNNYSVIKKLMLIYGSQHLSSASTTATNLRLLKTTLITPLDSLVITGSLINKTVIKNLQNYPGGIFSIGTITVAVPPPAIPALDSPNNLAINISTTPTLSWKLVSNATNYSLQVSENNSFNSFVFNQNSITGPNQQLSNLKNFTTYYWRVSATNTYGSSTWSSVWSFRTMCPPSITYAGKTYNTVQIGTQCWLKENLNVGIMIQADQEPSNIGVIEKYCYGNDPANCEIYGGLYQWAEAVRGICPTGWHIPTLAELQTLYTFVDKNSNTLKAIGQGTGSGAGTNASGFSALLTGYRMYRLGQNGVTYGDFDHIGYYTYFWSSSAYDIALAYTMRLGSNDITTYMGTDTKNLGFSVRCLKD
jgi:uncharacterized protein (TIGR02145 family)